MRLESTVSSPRDLILVVDDDPNIVALIRAYLVRAGFDVITARDGPAALRLAREHRPRLLVLDLMLPELDGMEVTREVRRDSDVPILMLTARGGLADRIRGLGEGADDYLAKPFAPSEVVARVQAILRRAPRDPQVLRHGDLEIDVERYEVLRGGEPLDLSPLEFRLLAALVEARGRVLSRDRLLDVLGGPHSDGVLERSVDVYVGRLRSKLGDDPDRPRYVATVRGTGYRAARVP
jgi:two-component system, OmpR family, alkaline phosphatase synthesis response regulator PhoP